MSGTEDMLQWNFPSKKKFKFLALISHIRTEVCLYKIAKGIKVESLSTWPIHNLTNVAPESKQ